MKKELVRLAPAKEIIMFSLLAVMVIGSPEPAFAADVSIESWKDLLDGALQELIEYVQGPAVVAFLMAQARAMFPFLGKLGVFTLIGDIVAGNWGYAKNGSK